MLPQWKYASYFMYTIPCANIKPDFIVEELHYHYSPEFWDAFAEDFRKKKVDILGWLQTEKYWQYSKKKVFDTLRFQPEFLKRTKEKFSKAFLKKTIAVSIRRGDYITNPNFYLLPDEYYFGALQQHFPDFSNYNILIFSDDINYCRMQIKQAGNIYFAKNFNAIEQLCLMSLCDNFIISNSTFSWWGAMLGEKADTKIIRPNYFFDGELLKKFDWKDYYPERWIMYDHKDKIIDPEFFKNTQFVRKKISLQIKAEKKYRKFKNWLRYKFGSV